MSLFPRFTQEFAPIFRLFDDYDRQVFRGLDQQLQSVRAFTPKFDVKETETAYELHGELPGVQQKDVSVEWADGNTLTVSGRHEVVREEGERLGEIEDAAAEQKTIESKAQQPSVEDETAQTSEASATPDSSQAVVAKQTDNQVTADQTAPTKEKYWISERSVGEFHRSFAFPARVDQNAVKASLKNGILSIVVPKAGAPVSRKIQIE
ncbi:heat shock protein-like protein 30 [Pyrenochaeta sp. DS3sAY3a]|nr:heat shock protein-like protein 30 [Pyrenochaeta sp. DS3sAY3a]